MHKMTNKIRKVVEKHQQRIPIVILAELLAVLDEEEANQTKIRNKAIYDFTQALLVENYNHQGSIPFYVIKKVAQQLKEE